jgi:hypothetical protein
MQGSSSLANKQQSQDFSFTVDTSSSDDDSYNDIYMID